MFYSTFLTQWICPTGSYTANLTTFCCDPYYQVSTIKCVFELLCVPLNVSFPILPKSLLNAVLCKLGRVQRRQTRALGKKKLQQQGYKSILETRLVNNECTPDTEHRVRCKDLFPYSPHDKKCHQATEQSTP